MSFASNAMIFSHTHRQTDIDWMQQSPHKLWRWQRNHKKKKQSNWIKFCWFFYFNGNVVKLLPYTRNNDALGECVRLELRHTNWFRFFLVCRFESALTTFWKAISIGVFFLLSFVTNNNWCSTQNWTTLMKVDERMHSLQSFCRMSFEFINALSVDANNQFFPSCSLRMSNASQLTKKRVNRMHESHRMSNDNNIIVCGLCGEERGSAQCTRKRNNIER